MVLPVQAMIMKTKEGEMEEQTLLCSCTYSVNLQIQCETTVVFKPLIYFKKNSPMKTMFLFVTADLIEE